MPLSEVDRRVAGISRSLLRLVAVCLTLLIGAVDWMTGYQINIAIFYLLPVAFITWYDRGLSGLVLAATCTLVWFCADLLTQHRFSHPAIPYWNALTRFLLFTLVAFMVARLRLAYRSALGRVETLTGLLPICAWCHKVRDDQGYWQRVEHYLRKQTQKECSHSICPECEARVRVEARDPSAEARNRSGDHGSEQGARTRE